MARAVPAIGGRLAEAEASQATRINALTRFGPGLLVLALALSLLAPRGPLLNRIPGPDSGMFLYMAQHILRGDLPYRDVWDHKPPLIFWIDTLSLTLTPGSLWGLWLAQAVSLSVAVVLSLRALGRVAGRWVGLAATTLWLLTFPTILERDANLTEAFALPLQFGALALVASGGFAARPLGRWMVVGALGGLALCLRQNLVGVWLSIGAALLVSGVVTGHLRGALLRVLSMGLGVGVVLAPVVAYLLATGTLAAFVDTSIIYNLRYSSPELAVRLGALLAMFRLMSPAGLAIMAVGGWMLAVLVVARRMVAATRLYPLVLVSLLDLPLETLLASTAGRQYSHYALACLPAAAVLAAYLLGLLSSALEDWRGRDRYGLPMPLFLVGLLLAASITPVELVLVEAVLPTPTESTSRAAINYLQQNTRPTDDVLVWGGEVQVNFMSGRDAPTRFPYQLPLFLPGYQSASLVDGFLAQLRAHPPVVVIDTARTQTDVPPIAPAERAGWRDSRRSRILPETSAVFDFICQNYARVTLLEPGGWPVYRRLDALSPSEIAAPRACVADAG